MFGRKTDWLEESPRYFTLEDYEGGVARWCPGCGDLGVLTAVQRICRDKQLRPEHTVCVSGIGCSSRFPHYMKTYGFHGLHGRPLPVACGIKARRPDLHVFVATGDGDCCSIGAAHWVHAVRYNMDLVVMLFDNAIYGLTKNQSSPTTPLGMPTNTHPQGTWIPPMNPLATTLSISNASFLAQTVDWNPAHLYATLLAAYEHRGLSFVRILQRCPTYSEGVFAELRKDNSKLLLLTHERGVSLEAAAAARFERQQEHDPSDIAQARAVAALDDPLPIGLLFRDPSRPCYESFTERGLGMTTAEKLESLERELDRFAV